MAEETIYRVRYKPLGGLFWRDEYKGTDYHAAEWAYEIMEQRTRGDGGTVQLLKSGGLMRGLYVPANQRQFTG